MDEHGKCGRATKASQAHFALFQFLATQPFFFIEKMMLDTLPRIRYPSKKGMLWSRWYENTIH